MCGIGGYFDPSLSLKALEAVSAIERMSRAITHRGPDDGGCFADPTNGIALTNRRLAVVDLSPQGRQPMASHDGRYVMVFNGEIYNHRDLRRTLAQHCDSARFRGHSDTETLLEAIALWGIRDALRRAIGMFALAVWDRERRELILSRDRVGEKPLYCGWNNGIFLFGSELKALVAHPSWQGKIDDEAEGLYFQFGYVPAPKSIYSGICKLPPGVLATIGYWATGHSATSLSAFAEAYLTDPQKRTQARAEIYWSPDSAVKSSADRLRLPDTAIVPEADRLLRQTIKRQILADVPVGTLLSGGVDSSLVTAIAQAESAFPVKTFTIGFEDSEYDESRFACGVAQHLGTDHTSIIVSPKEAIDVIPNISQIYDEPFADSSQIPTYLVSQLARSKVTVTLSGDGGDEVFGGYVRHQWIKDYWPVMNAVPLSLRRLAASVIRLASPEALDRLAASLATVRPSLLSHKASGDRMHKIAEILLAKNAADMNYRLVTGRWPPSGTLCEFKPPSYGHLGLDLAEQTMLSDLLTYLPDDILVKVDRASMAVSLETRAPLLDHQIIEFAWSLPIEQKIRAGTGKWVLREVLYKYVPRKLFDRPKAGFAIPVGTWLRGPLREWAESLLTPQKLSRQHNVDPALITKRWQEHLSCRRNWTEAIWCVLIYQQWLDHTGIRG